MHVALISTYLLLTLGAGLYAARSVRTLADYILAGRSIPLWLVMPTMFALWFGAESWTSSTIVLYTRHGGMWAITVTEFLETPVIVGCLIAVLVVASADSPTGLAAAIAQFRADGMLDPFTAFSADPAVSATGLPLLGAFEFAALLLAIGAGSLPSQDVYERVNSSRTE
jgi:Na+/proline symporter